MKLVVDYATRSLEEAQQLDGSRYDDADVIEWRADFRKKRDVTVAPAVFENLLDAKFYSPYGLELKVGRWSCQ